MRPSDDPSTLSPNERFQELASLLARGLLRLTPGMDIRGANQVPLDIYNPSQMLE
jgi:hypothetical protein